MQRDGGTVIEVQTGESASASSHNNSNFLTPNIINTVIVNPNKEKSTLPSVQASFRKARNVDLKQTVQYLGSNFTTTDVAHA
jgi:hypothetical protein